MPIKTKTEKKVVTKKITKRNNVDLVVTELGVPQEYPDEVVVPVVPDEPVEEQPVDLPPLVEDPVVGANGPAEPLSSVAEVQGELVSSSDEEVAKPKKTRVLKEGKPLVNEVGDYLNPLTNRYVKVGTTLYKRLIKDGMICVVPV